MIKTKESIFNLYEGHPFKTQYVKRIETYKNGELIKTYYVKLVKEV